MKKIIICLFLVSLTVCSVCGQDIVNLRMDRQQMGLRGNVASMDEDILLRKDYFREDWPQRKWFIQNLRNVLREDDGRIVTFNPSGRMTSITYTHQGQKGKTTQCSYASNGLLASYLGEGYKVEARYNGNMADINVFAETKDYKAIDLSKADLNTTPYNNTYPFDLKCRQELTDDGLVLKSSYYYVDSMLVRDCEYNYNHINQLTSERSVNYSSGERQVSTVKYTYDNRGFLVKKVTHSKSVDETCTYENNDNGDCVKMTVERPYGTFVYTFEYLYDEMNNWVVRLQYLDGVFDNAAVRSLTYHKTVAEPQPKAKSQKKSSKKNDVNVDDKPSKKEKSVDKKTEKRDEPAEKKVSKKSKTNKDEGVKTKKSKADNEEDTMSKEDRKAIEKAEKERKKAEKKSQKEKSATEKKAAQK